MLVTIYRGGASLAGSKGLAEGAGINLRAVAAAGAAPPLSLAPLGPRPAPRSTSGEHTLTFFAPLQPVRDAAAARALRFMAAGDTQYLQNRAAKYTRLFLSVTGCNYMEMEGNVAIKCTLNKLFCTFL